MFDCYNEVTEMLHFGYNFLCLLKKYIACDILI